MKANTLPDATSSVPVATAETSTVAPTEAPTVFSALFATFAESLPAPLTALSMTSAESPPTSTMPEIT
ncbi:hypothetical protein ACW9FB_13540 [Ralstonia mannitolilytica]